MRLGGTIIDDAALALLRPPYSSLCVGPDRNILIDPAHPVRYGNHSCDPNLWHDDAVTIVARRVIRAGEELTIDYATHTMSPGWSMPCQCGSELCRAVVSGDDWRRPILRVRYGRHWTPPLLADIAAIGPRDLGPGSLVRTIAREWEMRRQAKLLHADLTRIPELLRDVGLDAHSLRRDMSSAERNNSPLRVYVARLYLGMQRICRFHPRE